MSTRPSTPATRARNSTIVIFAGSGLMSSSWMSRVPDIREIMALTPGQLSMMVLAIAVGSILGLPLAGRLIQRLGSRRTVLLGAFLAFPGIIIASLIITPSTPIVAIVVMMAIFGWGIGVWDVTQNFEGTAVEQSIGKAIMPWFHAAFSAATVVGALVGSLMVGLKVPIPVHLITVSVLVFLITLWSVRGFLPDPPHAGAPVDRSKTGSKAPTTAKVRSAWLEPRTVLIGVMVLAAALTEGVANDWLAVAFVDGHALEKAFGVLATAVFLTFMTTGRILGTRLLDRYGRVIVLRTLFVSALIGCLLVVFGSTPVAFFGAALWGIGASLGFPVGMSAASDDPKRAAARLSVVSTIGYLAFLGGPAMIGFLGDHFGVLDALLAVGVISLLALFVVPAARPLKPNTETSEPAKVEA